MVELPPSLKHNLIIFLLCPHISPNLCPHHLRYFIQMREPAVCLVTKKSFSILPFNSSLFDLFCFQTQPSPTFFLAVMVDLHSILIMLQRQQQKRAENYLWFILEGSNGITELMTQKGARERGQQLGDVSILNKRIQNEKSMF